MGFALKGFVMGAAAAVGEKLDADEKAAREAAKLSATNLFKTYEANKVKTEEQVTKYTNNIALLKTNFKGLTEDQLYAGATNNAFMEGVSAAVKERNIDLSKIDTNQLIKIADTAPTKETAEQRVRKLFDESNVQPMQAAPQGLGYFRDRQANIQQQEFQRTAKALGVEPAALLASGKAKMPVAGVPDAEFNVAILNKVKTLQEQKDLIASEIVEAKRTNDEVRLTKATEDADRIRIAEDLTAKSSKTEDQIQTDLRNRIMSTNSLKDKTLLTAELRQRQVLSKLPGEGQEKVSQSNLITVASKAIASAISDRLTPGTDFIIVQNPDGTVTPQIKSISAANVFNKATEAGRAAVVKEMTNANGQPKDQLHRNALISIGVNFDNEGRAVVPKALQVDDKTGKPVVTPVNVEDKPAAPAAAVVPVAKITQAEFDKKWATLKSTQTLVGPDGVTYTKQ